MLKDNRLDFITNIHKDYIVLMNNARQMFIELDKELRAFDNLPGFDDSSSRCIALARTNIETACQYTIKALCLMGEGKDESNE